ncbi:ABC transporter ATP-binding protein [Halovivax gelatinilyticus]|uniref:ABC transporter ATP-binding protein n=1 Tax=Halovivax gelatinilyticus TaxID=2961597 RepID=UPI0020CA74F6|nr:ABC transporter ATP-binding protein [Halovivax gelatinilyticus]
MTHISLNDVSKYYDGGETVANYKLNLDIEDGEFLVFLGPSGCGKTTALRLIAGLEQPSEGEIYFDDQRVDGWSPSARNVAMVFQNYALYPHMTVKGNIEYPLKVRGMAPDDRDERVAEATELLHIEDQVDKPPAELSGGQRQRVALARAIVREPSVFLLDEPLSNLDAKLRQEMRIELKRLQNELDITTVYVTHNQEEAMGMADRVAVMDRGTIRQLAPPQELYERPRTAWVARFIGMPPMNLFEGTRRNGSIDIGEAGTVEHRSLSGGESRQRELVQAGGRSEAGGDDRDAQAVPVEADGEPAGANVLSLGVRPEDLDVRTEKPTNGNVISGTVDTIEPLGEYVLVNVSVNDQVVNAKVSDTDLERDDPVYLTFADEDAYLYDESGVLVA